MVGGEDAGGPQALGLFTPWQLAMVSVPLGAAAGGAFGLGSSSGGSHQLRLFGRCQDPAAARGEVQCQDENHSLVTHTWPTCPIPSHKQTNLIRRSSLSLYALSAARPEVLEEARGQPHAIHFAARGGTKKCSKPRSLGLTGKI